MNNFFNKITRKLSRLAIEHLMKYIVISMGAVFLLDLIFGGLLSSYLVFDKAAIFNGQVWRILSFIFIPISSSPIFIIFTLYFYWMIGIALENEWGAARFNLFYLTGIIGTIVAGLLTGYATNHYLNLSLFFAFAILFPNFEIRLFFLIPVKVKWLAYANAAFFAYSLIVSGWPQRIALLVSVANIMLFFGKGLYNRITNIVRRRKWKNSFR